MIVDNVTHSDLYAPLGPRVAAGLAYLRGLDPTLPDGRYAISGDDLFAIVESYETAPATGKRFESHRLHIDIQYLIAGRERILHAPAGALAVEMPYDTARDITFHHDPPASSSVLLNAGDLAILYPHDAHKPGCMAGGRDPVRKVVVKVRI